MLGGMVYDSKCGKGIRRKTLPEPNPNKVQISGTATLKDIFSKAKELYFPDKKNDNIEQYMRLSDSSGVSFIIDEPDKWTVETFYQTNNLKSSRHKLYVVFDEEVSLFL